MWLELLKENVTVKKKRYAQVGTGGRARFFYQAVARDYSETSEIVAFCDVNQTRMNYANALLEKAGASRVPTYKHFEFEKMIEEIKKSSVATEFFGISKNSISALVNSLEYSASINSRISRILS